MYFHFLRFVEVADLDDEPHDDNEVPHKLFVFNQKFGFVKTSGGTDPDDTVFKKTSGISGGGKWDNFELEAFIKDKDDDAVFLNMSGIVGGGSTLDIVVDIAACLANPSCFVESMKEDFNLIAEPLTCLADEDEV